MEIAVVVLAIVALGGFVGWLWAQRGAGLAREQLDELRASQAETANGLTSAQIDLAAARTSLDERSDQLRRAREQGIEAQTEIQQLRRDLAASRETVAALEQSHQARSEELEQYRADLEQRFKGLALDALQLSNEEFRKQAEDQFKRDRELADTDLEKRQQAVDNLVKPVGETLEKLQKRVGEIEEKRENAYGMVVELIGSAGKQIGELRATTTGLRQALSSPQQRGRWGELTLERVLEVSGMREHVDYLRQAHTVTEDGAIRPDAVIKLPRGLSVPVDAKTPLEAYLRANESDDEVEQRAALAQHAAALMNHARALGSKNYADAIDGKSPDFVVLFVPTETILDAAMVAQPTIWEDAWTQHKVLIASPGLLIALLRTIGVAWQQEDIQQNAQEIADTSRELYGRLATYSDHVGTVGKALASAVRAYNSSVGSFQSRVLVQARRMEELGAVEESRRIEDPASVELEVRQLSAPELRDGDGA